MWDRSSKIWSWRKICGPCRKVGQQRHGTSYPVCLETGGACAKEAKLAPLPDIQLTRRAASALRLFYACATQWRSTMGGLIGLDYVACRLVADSLQISWDDTFPLLKELEGERLSYVNEQEEARAEEADRARRVNSRGR